MIRIGQGFDVHRVDAGDGMTLGGLWVPCAYRVVAHSDGDIVLHAIMDAMLGALALGDIGQLFPDTDASFQGADSAELTREVRRLCLAKGYSVSNLDVTILCEVPKIAPIRETMRQCIADVLETVVDQISVKATTTEQLGFIGRGEGIAVMASVLMRAH
ncbi:MAG: 2-C-methyl-D-erythritol 2,4-cyclodiphosphate synthase [Oceanospirillales bacterium]|nr:2-C-methyl-D-erythritol 2,4-cyclodiphosphate synthase [Litorivicinus sp.]MBT6288361.1 2-C-methyl-D-erythritol 2,4-cyclodiphosphate synthase [Oceanospirillales bacterium]MDA0894573.1 2-C-methyl-D-erythritol 2,4-cyclodiphosphate synthase [Pseudomonadota bacterium]HAB68073.1 2-C-methyl-D-erythritol 2,4-cyclodiphosphate synthase [Gammaproteobacteria bacterium]